MQCKSRYINLDQHGLWCTGENVSSLIRGLGFESWEWKNILFEVSPLNGSYSTQSKFNRDSMNFEHRARNQKKSIPI